MKTLLLLTMFIALLGALSSAEWYTAMWVVISLCLFIDNIVVRGIMHAQHKILMDTKDRLCS
jgi:hypothetical protein